MALSTAFLRRVELPGPAEEDAPRTGYPWELPVVAGLAGGLDLHPAVTFFVGENGAGKSTLVEAIAIAAGLNPEGGSRNFVNETRASHSPLGTSLRLVRGMRRPRTEWFLRAESVFTTATYLEQLPASGGDPLAPYGGRSLHEQSHGESFLAIVTNRFGPRGLYLLDEPESALSAQNCLTLLRAMHDLVLEGSQFVVATHSPILLGYPGALIYECDASGIAPIEYDQVPSVRLTRSFLDEPGRFLHALLDE